MTLHRVLSMLSVLLLATGAVQGLRGGWIHAKAGLAQVLIRGPWHGLPSLRVTTTSCWLGLRAGTWPSLLLTSMAVPNRASPAPV